MTEGRGIPLEPGDARSEAAIGTVLRPPSDAGEGRQPDTVRVPRDLLLSVLDDAADNLDLAQAEFAASRTDDEAYAAMREHIAGLRKLAGP